MSVFEAYKARSEIQESGVWSNICGGKVKIKFMKGNAPLMRKVEALDLDSLSESEAFDKWVVILAEEVVLDWKGFECKENKTGEYSKDAFVDACNKLKDMGFVQDILSIVMDSKLLDSVAEAKVAKN